MRESAKTCCFSLHHLLMVAFPQVSLQLEKDRGSMKTPGKSMDHRERHKKKAKMTRHVAHVSKIFS